MGLVEVASLWIGDQLSWLEQLCLQSFVDAGHRTTLFTYRKVEGIPDGVYVEDANSIFPSDKIIRHARTGSPAYHADVFRLHLIKNNDVIWVDTDAYCVKPFIRPDNGHYHGWISDNVKQINNGVLGLPKTSKTLKAMLDFTSDEYPVPPWLTPRKREELQSLKDKGKGVHVSLLPWGVWGPNALTHFLHDTGEVKYSQPKDVIYPIPFSHKKSLLKPSSRHRVESWVTQNTTSIHFWGRRFRSAASVTGGIPPEGSYTADLLIKHNIDPRPTAHLMQPANPIKPVVQRPSITGVQQTRNFLGQIDVEQVTTIAGMSASSAPLLIAAHQKYDCNIDVISIADTGAIGDTASTVQAEKTRQEVIAGGVPADKVQIIQRKSDLGKYDIISMLDRWGVRNNIKQIEPILRENLAGNGHLFIDIKKGSGGYPFLRNFGNCQKLEQWEDQGKRVDRVVMIAEPQETTSFNPEWKEIASKLIGDDGFFRENDQHCMTYIQRSKTLCVTFDNLDIAMNKRDDRRPWGYKFIEDQDWSMLALMANGWTWFRDPWVFEQFDQLKNSGFFQQFDRVIFYGASMGGYGALVFSRACPGADVVAFTPQTILDKTVVPWETRYRVAWEYDFSGPYGDAVDAIETANRVSIFYDPYSKLDAKHISRLKGKNVIKFRAPFFGHRLGSMFAQMGILQPIVLSAINRQLDAKSFYSILRKRRNHRRYRKEMVDNLIDQIGRASCRERV